MKTNTDILNHDTWSRPVMTCGLYSLFIAAGEQPKNRGLVG